MDPFSFATGVVGLLAVIAQVSEAVNFYIGAIQDRRQVIQDLYQELILLRNVLIQLQEFFLSEKAKNASFDSSSVLGNAVSDCTRRLERVGDKLRSPGGDKLARALAKLKWPIEQDEIERLLANLQRFVQTFSFALTAQGLSILAKTSESAEAALKENRSAVQKMVEMGQQFGIPTAEQEKLSMQLDHVLTLLPTLGEQAVEIKEMSQHLRVAEEREQARQKAELLNWLLPGTALQKHAKTQRQRANNTCEWFLHSQSFEKWHDLSRPAHDMLCTGNPGVGKTVLASFVFDHLRTKFRAQQALVINHYCSHFEENTQTPGYFVKNLLRQVCQSLDALPPLVVEFYQRTRHDLEDILWLQELRAVLRSIISSCNCVFIIVDALDEIEDIRQRNTLLSTLKDLRKANQNLRLFATARPHVSDLHVYFNLPAVVNISAQQTDIEKMLLHKLEERPDFEPFSDQSFRQDVISKLCSSSSGTFLLPALQLDHILEQVTKADVRLALKNLSQTLEEAFRTSLDRINCQPSARRSLAFRTMMWISHVKRPLEMVELQHALAMKDSDPGHDLDHENIVPARIILESCSGLVQLEAGTVTFVHFSLDEYLASRASSLLLQGAGDCETQIVRTSLIYLMQGQLKELSSMNADNFRKAIENYPFLRYAACTWGIHARQLEPEKYSDLAFSMFDSGMNLITVSRVREIDFPYARKWGSEAASWAYSGGAGISIAAGFGLPALVNALLQRCQDTSVINRCRNGYGNTALQDAAGWGYTEVCKILVSYGADLMCKNKSGATAFYQAVTYGRLEVARELLKHHRGQLDARCRDGWTALHKAADLGDEEMVRFLLSSGALYAAQDDAGMAPIHLAAGRGHLTVARLLILAGADVNALSSISRCTPLCLASTCGHTEVVRYLLQQGAHVNNQGADSWTPLFRASRGGHTESVNIILQYGADIMHIDYHKNNCLQMAARSGNLEVVKALLNHDPSVRPQLLGKRDSRRRTAQQIALTTAHIEIYKHLRDLQHQIDTEAGTEIEVYDPSLPLALSIEAQDLRSVETILQRNPELLHQADTSSQLPIHLAFIECAVDVARFLLAVGASIDSQGYHSWQPLHIAASLGSIEMIELALSHGADVNALTASLQTPLLKAASAHSVTALRRLLEAGADPWARNDKGMTCLHVSASKNFVDGIRELLSPEWGAKQLIYVRDQNQRLPRYWAQRSGHHETVRFLRLQEKLIGNTIPHERVSSQSPMPIAGTTSSASSSSLPSRLTLSRASVGYPEPEDVLTQMVLELDSD